MHKIGDIVEATKTITEPKYGDYPTFLLCRKGQFLKVIDQSSNKYRVQDLDETYGPFMVYESQIKQL